MAGIVVVGESLIDVVVAADGTRTEHVGGSATNTAIAMARLGESVRLASSWGDDARGARIAAHLAADRVALACDPLALARTSTAVARIGVDGAATYDFDLDWRLSEVPDDLDPGLLHVCSLGAVLEPGATQVGELVARWPAVPVSYDVNARPAVTGSGPEVVRRVEAVAARSDLVKASDEDLAVLYPDLSSGEAMAHLLTLGPTAVVLTRGAEGAVWLDADRQCLVDSAPATVVDTIGAGDTFGAALVHELLGLGWFAGDRSDRRDVVPGVLHQAARAAAITVSRPGADPPYASELRPLPGSPASEIRSPEV